MKLEALEYKLTSEELGILVECDCTMQWDCKGFALIKDNMVIAELYGNKSSLEQIIKQINLYDEFAEVIASNLVAWDSSLDKKQSVLPEVYLTNRRLYKQFTGEDYTFDAAIEKFRIGQV